MEACASASRLFSRSSTSRAAARLHPPPTAVGEDAFDPTGYWHVWAVEACNDATFVHDGPAEMAAVATPPTDYELRPLGEGATYRFAREQAQWTFAFAYATEQAFPAAVSDDGATITAEGRWTPRAGRTCDVHIRAERYPGPQVCELLTPEDRAAVTTATRAAIENDAGIRALHALWRDHAEKWRLAGELSPGAYRWQSGAWSYVTATTALQLAVPGVGVVTYADANDGWGSFDASLTGTTFTDWTVHYWGPRSLDDGSSGVTFGAWRFGHATCDTVCQGYQTFSMDAPFGSYAVSYGDGVDRATPIVRLRLDVAGRVFSVASAFPGYTMRYGMQETTVTEAQIAADCPRFIEDKLALFPDVGAALTTGFPLDYFDTGLPGPP